LPVSGEFIMKHCSALPLAAILGIMTLAPATGQSREAQDKATAASRPAALKAPDMKPIPIAFEKFVLPNGLTVVVHENRKTPVVAVGLWYHVGSANETPGRTGFAHLFEHLMFNGSEHANTDWFEQMNDVGASAMNGTTDFDKTSYFQVVPTVALDRVLWLESDRMANLLPVVDQARLDEQRKVVQNEKRQRENQPLAKLGEVVMRGSYPAGHPYSWEPIGSMEDLNSATLEDVRAFFNRWYRPNNAVLVLSGDVTPAQARQKVERYFGTIPAGPPLDRVKQWTAKRTGQTRVQMDVQTANPMLFKFWNVPGTTDPQIPALRIAAHSLGEGQDSFLHKRLVIERRLASEVRAAVSTMALGSILQVNATARPGVSLKALEVALDEEIAVYLRAGPSAAEVERYKRNRHAGTIRAQTGVLGLASRLAENEIFAGDPGEDARRQQRTLDVTPSQARDAARAWMSDGVFVVEARALPSFKVSSGAVDRNMKPLVGQMADFDLPPLQHATLSNGVRIALAERHDVPTLAMTMYFNGGALPDRNLKSVGLSEAFSLAATGTRTRTREDISNALERDGSSVYWTVAQEDTRFNMDALRMNLDPTLDLYADILLNPSFPEAEWTRTRERFARGYEEAGLTPTGKFARLTPRYVVGVDHPYAARLTPETIGKLTTSDLRRFYAKWVRPDNATLLIVGDTTLAEIVPKLEKRLSGWRAPSEPLPVKAVLPPAAKPQGTRVVLIDQPGAKSSIVKVLQAGGPRSSPDFEVFRVVNTILGGHFLSRLNMNLRERKGWSYGAASNIESAPVIGLIDAGGQVQADKTAEAMREIEREVRDIASGRPPTDAEVIAAKNALLLGMPALLEGPNGVKDFYAGTFEYGLPEDYWRGYVRRVQALTPDQVRAAARRLYRPSEMTWIVVGDLATIEADVRKLGLGAVEVVDASGNLIR
jgi:zinc protease